VFVKNIGKEATSEDLYNAFFNIGDVKNCKLSLNKDHVNNSYGYVNFVNEEDAAKAIQEVNYFLKVLVKRYQDRFRTYCC
jgi:RNA recognition motif-containing protein